MGKGIIIAGIALVVIGALVHYAPWAFTWFGKLPGDIRIQGEKGNVFIPLTSTILLSILLSIIVNVLRR
jgi:hypothetical protein